MKTKLVLWGKNAEEKRVLTAIELKPETNTVGTYIFPDEVANDDLANELMQKWRDGKEMEMPENHTYSEQPLSITERVIPEGLELERADLLTRAQTEWQFVVLSSKLNDAYQSELQELKDKIQQLKKYDSKVWSELKTFWDKVRGQIREHNLFREHADTLQTKTNELFKEMKDMRAKMEEGFKANSQAFSAQFHEKLEGIEKQINEGSRLSSVFEELKTLQRKFRQTKFTKEDRDKIWDRLDGAFKAVKEKRFGPQKESDNTAMGRLTNRLDGLLRAKERMEKSIKRDEDDLAFQKRKIATTHGQLESQIRQAKVAMIEERIRSKQERLKDMKKTQAQIEKQIERQKVRDAKDAERKKIELAKQEAKAKIDEQIATSQAALEEQATKLEKAAEAIKSTKDSKEEVAQEDAPQQDTPQEEETLLSAVSDVMSETLEDVGDTLKAVASVVGAKAKEKLEDLKAAGQEVIAEAKEEIAERTEAAKEKIEEVKEEIAGSPTKATEKIEEVKAEVEVVAENTEEVIAERADQAEETLEDAAKDAEEKKDDVA
ncbi:MAG: hypothetical protein AAF806_13080 [Bacteroidota bacterium]